MEEERRIKKYFKPVGLRRRSRPAFFENSKLKTATPKSTEIEELNDSGTQVNSVIKETSLANTKTEDGSAPNVNNVVVNKKSQPNLSLGLITTSSYRKKSLMRAKGLVSKALSAKNEELKAKTNVAPVLTFENKVTVRKRLFNCDQEEATGEENLSADCTNSTTPKYKQLKEKLSAVPAFKRFKHLIDTPTTEVAHRIDYPYETDFPLPASYEKLLQFFKAADAVLYIMYQRKEGCNFLRLKKMVEASTRKSFWRSDLARIVGLRPRDFKIYLNENSDVITGRMAHNKAEKRDSALMISPDYTEALEKFTVSESPIPSSKYDLDQSNNCYRLPCTPLRSFKHTSPCKTPKLYSPICVSPIKSPATYETPTKVDSNSSPSKSHTITVRPSHLTWRKDQVRSVLLRKTHDQHKMFLKQIGLDNLNYAELKQWHPKFNLDDVESIVEATLPDAFKFKTTSTAKDLLADTEIKLNSVIRKAVEEVVEQESSKSELGSLKENDDNDTSSGVFCMTPVCQKVLSSMPNSFLERIRDKEKKNAQIQMMIKHDADDERNKLQKLPELLKLMFNYLRSEKKTCMIFPKVVDKMMQSSKQTISRELMEAQIVLLSKIVPDLVSIPQIGNHRFVKIVQIKCTLNDALGIIQEKISST